MSRPRDPRLLSFKYREATVGTKEEENIVVISEGYKNDTNGKYVITIGVYRTEDSTTSFGKTELRRALKYGMAWEQ